MLPRYQIESAIARRPFSGENVSVTQSKKSTYLLLDWKGAESNYVNAGNYSEQIMGNFFYISDVALQVFFLHFLCFTFSDVALQDSPPLTRHGGNPNIFLLIFLGPW